VDSNNHARPENQLVSIRKLERVEIGVLQDETQTHGCARKFAHVISALPRQRAINCIAEYFIAVVECGGLRALLGDRFFHWKTFYPLDS
jgi:hypothetical protein